MTKLGLREGHDAIDSAITPTPPIAPQVYDQLTIRTSEYPGTSFDPYLSITYTQTTESTTTSTTNELTYAYDHGMRRVSKTFDGVTTYYPTSNYSVTDGVSTVYVSDSSGLVASLETDPSTGSGSPSSTSTIHTDHLGSTSVVTDESGIMVELMDYNPYGTERISWSSSSDDGEAESQKTYIGEYSDDETGLSYLNARYYDPGRGQFLSQDKVYLSLGSGNNRNQKILADPQQQNAYSYSRGNPIIFIDPTGESTSVYIEKGNGSDGLKSIFGHAFVDINGTTYSWAFGGGQNGDYGDDLTVTSTTSFLSQKEKMLTLFQFLLLIPRQNKRGKC